MKKSKNLSVNNEFKEDVSIYENVDKKKKIEAILATDSEKFKKFTKLFKIGVMLKNAKISHSNPK